MQTADVVIGVLAVFALIGTFVGVATYEPPETLEFDVRLDSQESAVAKKPSLTLEGDGDEATDSWSIGATNITEAHFSARMSGPRTPQLRTEAVVVTLEIVAPNGATKEVTLTLDSSGAETTEELHFAFDAMEMPKTLEGGNATEAAEDLPAPDTNATGTWNVTATVTSAGARSPPVVGDFEAVTVEVTMTLTTYTALLEKRSPGGDLSPAA